MIKLDWKFLARDDNLEKSFRIIPYRCNCVEREEFCDCYIYGSLYACDFSDAPKNRSTDFYGIESPWLYCEKETKYTQENDCFILRLDASKSKDGVEFAKFIKRFYARVTELLKQKNIRGFRLIDWDYGDANTLNVHVASTFQQEEDIYVVSQKHEHIPTYSSGLRQSFPKCIKIAFLLNKIVAKVFPTIELIKIDYKRLFNEANSLARLLEFTFAILPLRLPLYVLLEMFDWQEFSLVPLHFMQKEWIGFQKNKIKMIQKVRDRFQIKMEK